MAEQILSFNAPMARTARAHPALPESGDHHGGGDAPARRAAAAALEASFLSVMLQSAGFGAARESFGGGAGEEHFSSFLVATHAEALVQRGGIGLSEALFRALGERDHAPE
ncbi:rod-binding protein [Alkalilacustris brevis]|uniref:rod-binding protein n=1 Tax=Alkalilacustris brevis TaxID=2026338 RepID=UPI001EE3C489|nr:rod-binding protein [Alkalilacustris brevis]